MLSSTHSSLRRHKNDLPWRSLKIHLWNFFFKLKVLWGFVSINKVCLQLFPPMEKLLWQKNKSFQLSQRATTSINWKLDITTFWGFLSCTEHIFDGKLQPVTLPQLKWGRISTAAEKPSPDMENWFWEPSLVWEKPPRIPNGKDKTTSLFHRSFFTNSSMLQWISQTLKRLSEKLSA